MPMFMPPWDTDIEPNDGNIKIWMDNLYGKFEPLTQARWNQSNIDCLFYAGEQRFINSYYNFYPTYNAQNFAFNIIQPINNMVTGYQRQHRKSVNYIPIEGSKQEYADDLTKLVTYANNYRQILEKLSTAYEQSTIAGSVLIQPYLDYCDDPVNGTLDLKIWSYNSFMQDEYYRDPLGQDSNFWWCQQYISKIEAINQFPDKINLIHTMSGFANRGSKFYFLPENYNLARHDLLVMSYIWYKSKRTKKMLYNHENGITYEYADDDRYMEEMLNSIGSFEVIEVQVPTWKLAVVLNDSLMFLGNNPLGFDESPLIPVYWNRDSHVAQYDLRDRSLTRSLRDANFLFNRRVILNHDISESSINSGWLRKENAVANPEDLRYSGQGKDIIIKDGYELADITKIVPNAVPPSDMELANQLSDLIYKVSGVNQELMGMANDSNAGIEVMLRQGAGLVTLQKYFDQWDRVLAQLGVLEQKIIQNNWSPSKIGRILGKEPNPEFLNKTYSKYDVLVAEGINTTIQQQQEFYQIRQLNAELGGIIPPKFILSKATIQGKNEIIAAVEEKEKMANEMQQQQMLLEHSKIEAELQNLQAKSANEIAMARERHGRAESNIGLFEERLSEITQNRSASLKNKVDALEKLLQIYSTFGQSQAMHSAGQLEQLNVSQELAEDREKADAKVSSESNRFLTNMMQNNEQQNNMSLNQPLRSLL